MHFVVRSAEGAVVMRGESSEMLAPPLEASQTLEWRAAPLPFATLDPSDPETLLSQARDRADKAVRAYAEAQRLRFISPGVGKAMAYQQKAAEAEAFLEAESPTERAFPHIFGEASAMGIDPAAMAELILQLRDRWQIASAEIERIERAAIRAIASARAVHEVEAASVVDWSALDTFMTDTTTSEQG